MTDIKPNGKISITFRRRSDGRTYMAKQYYKLPLQVMKPHYYDEDGTAFVYSLNPAGGILQHDRLLTEIVSEAGTDAVFTTPGNSKFYRMDDGCARIWNRISVHSGGVLEYLPEHNVPFADSTVYQENEFRLGKGAVLFASDMVTSGRAANGEVFRYNLYSSKTKIYVDDELILYDNCRMEPALEDLRRRGLMDGRKSNGSMYVYAEAMDPELKERINGLSSEPVKLAAGNITPDLMVARFLGDGIMDMVRVTHEVWDLCRRSILGKPAVRLRKEFSDV
ncbi:MAG: urease accessory protein UreD [Clostridiales bacterium]|nr:urease accessory protein UreD [Clostridiales bacterium]MDD7035696.1 urease accessory protein UreD [Bacillota bacterium]MDY2920656.1 urease accessory protein UreD [Lentihominibacter sp.]